MSLQEFAGPGGIRQIAGPGNPLPVGGGDPSLFTGLIASGSSISGIFDLGNSRVHRISTDGWTAAAVGFDASFDGVTFGPLCSDTGEYGLASGVMVAGRQIVVDQGLFYGIRYVRVRSGVIGAAVSQGADRNITIFTVPR